MSEDKLLKLKAKRESMLDQRNKIDEEITALKQKGSEVKSKIDDLTDKIDKIEGNCYYVYIVFVEGVPKYVGKGTGDRYKHAVSGTSSVKQLNKDLFDDKHIEVRIVFGRKNMSEQKALKLELDTIYSLQHCDLYNKKCPEKADYMDMDAFDYSDFAIGNKDSKLSYMTVDGAHLKGGGVSRIEMILSNWDEDL